MQLKLTEKPQSITMKQWLIKLIAQRTDIPSIIVEEVVNHQFDEASSAMLRCNSIEFSGFGKLFFNVKKANKKMEKFMAQKKMYEGRMNDETLSDAKRKNAEYKLNSVMHNIDVLSTKLNCS